MTGCIERHWLTMQPLIFKGGTAYENENDSIGFGFYKRYKTKITNIFKYYYPVRQH